MYLRGQAAPDDAAKDVIDGSERGHCHVEQAKLPLQSVWDVVATPPRVDHRSRVTHVDEIFPLARPVERVQPSLAKNLRTTHARASKSISCARNRISCARNRISCARNRISSQAAKNQP
jgi:hypothetical protein